MKKIIKLRTVVELTGLSRSTIYDYMSRGMFPKQLRLGENSVAWLESEVVEWLDEKIKQRDEA